MSHRETLALPPFVAVIFDMDGLLLDTEPTYAFAWQQAGRVFGIDLDDAFLYSLVGSHADEVEQRLSRKIGAGFDRERFFAHAKNLWHEHIAGHGIALMPGAEAILAELARIGLPYALATNSDSRAARLCLELSGLAEQFPLRVCRDEVAAGKPEPDVFVEAARRLNVALEHCLVLEDSATGVLGAYRAGALPVLVSHRKVPAEISKLTLGVFQSLHDVRALLMA